MFIELEPVFNNIGERLDFDYEQDLSDLQIEPEKDYFTLVTCTPYGINTHRLLVRAHRIANAQGEAMVIADAIQIESVYIAPFIAAPIILLLILNMIISTTYEGRMKRKRVRAEAALRRRVERIKKRSDDILKIGNKKTRARRIHRQRR